jgi:crotonobetainyl-CoA:carnitine CoA-transferase CaiB-like acyl-CoA transferase
VPCAPVLGIADVARDPQTLASGMLADTPDEPGVPSIPTPIRFDGVRPGVRSGPPAAGAHQAFAIWTDDEAPAMGEREQNG